MGIGYLASILHKRQPDQTADTYTLKGCRLEIRLQMKENPEMAGDLPGCMDKYAWGLALFFIIQYLVLFVMQ